MASQSRSTWLLCCVLLLLALASAAALAHEDQGGSSMHEEMHGHTGMHHTVNATHKQLFPATTVVYQRETRTGPTVVAAVMFSVAKSNLHWPTQALFLVLHGLGIFCSVVCNSQTPDLYPKNAHHRMGWVATFVLLGQAAVGIIFLSGSRNVENNMIGTAEEQFAFIPTGFRAIPQGLESPERPSWMTDSAHGSSERSSSSNSSNISRTRGHSMEQHRKYFPEIPLQDKEDDAYEMSARDKPHPHQHQQRSTLLGRLANRITPRKQFSPRAVRAASFFYSLVQRIIIIWGFIILLSGLVTLTGAFMGGAFFNGLAHLVKGGIFFLLGVLTLGRYLGTFAEIGWAWNLHPSDSLVDKNWLARVPSMEMAENFTIFLYGITTIFMEHLTAWGMEWSPIDLQHVSVSFWFIGGGLCGMLLESGKLKSLLDSVLQNDLSASSPQFSASIAQDTEPTTVRSPNFNPAPSLVLFMLGILMGGHHQHAMLGAIIHKQWGMLLSGFAVMRLGTYALLYLAPPRSYLPTRPFTELLGSFCLMSGGLIFMMSNAATVNYLDTLGIDAMFVFTVMIGLTALIMSWEVILLALKGWAARREILRHAKSVRYNATA